MYIKVNKNTRIIEDYSEELFSDLSEDYFQLKTTFDFRPSLEEGHWKNVKGHIFEFIAYKDNRHFSDNQYSYTDFINLVGFKNGLNRLQFKELTNLYKIWFVDGTVESFCLLYKDFDSASINDFKTKYQSYSNQKIDPIETATGWMKIRSRKVSGDLKGKYVYFTTGDDQSLDADGDTHYSIAVTTGKTIIDFMPNYNYEIAGGYVRINATAMEMEDNWVKAKFIMAPDIPVEYGGSWPFISNKKFNKYCLEYSREVDPKLMKYDAVNPINKIRLELTYDTNPEVEVEIYLDIYIV